MTMRPSTIEKRRQRRIERARKGGLATKAKYGHDYYIRIGKLGGRPSFWKALAKAKAREVYIGLKGAQPGRPRKAPPD